MPPQDTAGGPKTVIHSLMVDWVREGFAVCVCVYVLVCERECVCAHVSRLTLKAVTH